MKKVVSLFTMICVLYMSVFATEIKVVNTTYEQSLLKSAGIKDYSLVTNEDWYFSKDGIDKTSEKMVKKLPNNKPVILYGISLGGTVARRMTQIAAENGKNVKGYIAQSSPLSGDRLTNKAWASTSLALLAGYSMVTGYTLLFGLPLEEIFNRDCINEDFDFCAQLDDNSRSLINNLEYAGKNKSIDRSSNESVIENVTLPLLDAVFGNDENNRGTMFNYFHSVFGSNNNNVKDLDPTGNFMTSVMNTDASMKKEATDKIKRAFIESTNGNIYETSLVN